MLKEEQPMATDVTSQPRVRKFSSPPHVIVRSLLMSRDNWKMKYQELQEKLKRAQVRAYDSMKSREGWRERAEAAERELKRLRSEASLEVVSERASPKK